MSFLFGISHNDPLDAAKILFNLRAHNARMRRHQVRHIARLMDADLDGEHAAVPQKCGRHSCAPRAAQ